MAPTYGCKARTDVLICVRHGDQAYPIGFSALRLAALPPPVLHVVVCDLEAGLRVRHDGEPPEVGVAGGDEVAARLPCAAAHAAPQLVQLRQPKALRMFHHLTDRQNTSALPVSWQGGGGHSAAA
jgi:hypothetical protein